MKKIQISIAFLMVMVFLSTANSFVEKRLQWWEIRLKSLEEEKQRVTADTALDRRVLAIIDHEMDRGREIMAVFKSEIKNDGSLSDEKKVMAESDIIAEAKNTVPHLFALHAFEGAVRESEKGSADNVRDAVRQRLAGMIRTAFSRESPELVKQIMERRISRDEWKSLSVEYYLGSIMVSRKASEEHAVADIAARVSAALKNTMYRASSRELRCLLIRHAIEYLGECDSHMAGVTSAALDASCIWKRKEAQLARDFTAYKTIMAMADPPGNLPLERTMFFHKNPLELDSLLFKGQHPRQEKKQSPMNARNGSVTMEIPGAIDIEIILDEIDRLRKGTIPVLTGREDPAFFDQTARHFTAAINRRIAPVHKRFSREEERIRLLRKKDGKALLIANEDDFIEAKNNFQAARSLIEGYMKKSIDYLAAVSRGRSVPSASIVEEYGYRIQRDREYLRFTAGLVEECSLLSSADDPRVHKRISYAVLRAQSFFDFINRTLVLERDDQTHLTKPDLAAIRELKTGFTGTVNSFRGDIRNSYSHYSRMRALAAGSEKKKRGSLQDTIAQDEIDGLYRHVGECVELFEEFHYGEKQLYRYAEQFATFMKEARSGAPSRALERTLSAGSLLTSLDNYDGSRIMREFTTRRYLRNEAQASLARLAALLEFYKKNRVVFKDSPSPADMAALEGRLAAVPHIRIDSWIMNESNVAEIDTKAAKKLSLILNRRELASGGSIRPRAARQENSGLLITIKEPELSLAFPRDWEEESVGEAETYLGIVKSFHSGDGASSVRLVRLPLDKDDMKNTAEGWIQKSGCTLVEKRWERTGDCSYLWILAKDKNRNIHETCSVSKDGYALLITGQTSRDQYVKFKAQFKKIIESVRMETL